MSITSTASAPPLQTVLDNPPNFFSCHIDFSPALNNRARLTMKYQIFQVNKRSDHCTQNMALGLRNFLNQLELSPFLNKIFEDRTFFENDSCFIHEIYLIDFS